MAQRQSTAHNEESQGFKDTTHKFLCNLHVAERGGQWQRPAFGTIWLCNTCAPHCCTVSATSGTANRRCAHLHGRAQHEQVLHGLHEHARPRLGQADRADGLLLAAVLHGHVVPAGPAHGYMVTYPRRYRVPDPTIRLSRRRPPRPAAGRGGPARPGGARGSEPLLPLRQAAAGSRWAAERCSGLHGMSAVAAPLRRQHRALDSSLSHASGARHAPVSLLYATAYMSVSEQAQTCVWCGKSGAHQRSVSGQARNRACCGGTGAHQRSKRQRKSELSTDAHARLSSGNTPQKHTVWQAW